ncbi:hypothetical protein [Streptomyces sp. YU58]|uniref:hypothetical protein n=1 Tax=Streptomyces sp. SX92 TaxID=3158972 RepID=UPI0027B885FF|nr:hypothetical protein [Streptomyces coralus]WLW54850.1 hypothetical protein QU709_27465 [Streptomyces coralus]
MRNGVARRTAGVVVAGVIVSCLGAAPADAVTAKDPKCPSTTYTITSKKNYFVKSWWNGTHLKDGPGGTMSLSVTKSGTLSATASASTDVSVKAIVAKAKVTVSASVTTSVTVTVGHQFTHDITKGKYGNAQYGSWGYKVGFTKKKTSYNGYGYCSVHTTKGTAVLPTSSTGWKYWETKS